MTLSNTNKTEYRSQKSDFHRRDAKDAKKITNHKLQITNGSASSPSWAKSKNNIQIQNSKFKTQDMLLCIVFVYDLGHWNLFVIWDLRFVI